MKELREVANVARWTIETIWIGNVEMFQFLRRAMRLHAAIGPNGRCPRGHSSPVHNVFQCKCGAIFEGWAFEHCPVCRQSAGWTPCVRCGLPIRNPFR